MANQGQIAKNSGTLDKTKLSVNATECGKIYEIGCNLGAEDKELAIYDTLSTQCMFSHISFEDVMLNLIKNPNITSSHLFRADILYDSVNDVSYQADDPSKLGHLGTFTKYMKSDLRPLSFKIADFKLSRTIVRQLIPRNPNLDKALVQTCHFLTSETNGFERTMVVYLPHVNNVDKIPFYHPAVRMLAFVHSSSLTKSDSDGKGTNEGSTDPLNEISIKVSLPSDGHSESSSPQGEPYAFSKRLKNTFANLLRTIHKHGTSHQLQNYTKRVHHDQVVPQKAFQDTYTRLKLNYAKELIENWQESTDPGKHVFEDLGIAAFLIELWSSRYKTSSKDSVSDTGQDSCSACTQKSPKFIDIGCGNGLLVNLLCKEGYEGRGFDARERKSWASFEKGVRDRLQERILVPSIFMSTDAAGLVETTATSENCFESNTDDHDIMNHNGEPLEVTLEAGTTNSPSVQYSSGIFSAGTFIVSNHADELTAWTPLLAYLSQCPFICIPCCSHDLSGARTRFWRRSRKDRKHEQPRCLDCNSQSLDSQPKTGSLARAPSEGSLKTPSAYSSLCAYVTELAQELGFTVEKEALRIPSTRNAAIIGCPGKQSDGLEDDLEQRQERVRSIVQRELGKSIDEIGAAWLLRAQKIASVPSSGH